MIRLNIPKEPYWIDLPSGVRAKVRPLSTAIYEAARARGWRVAKEILKQYAEIKAVGGNVAGLPDMGDEDATAGLSQMLFAQALARYAILEWEGVGDADGNELSVTPEAVDELMRLPGMASQFVVEYVDKFERLVAEGNASRPSPNGTSAAGRNTARAAATPEAPAPTAA